MKSKKVIFLCALLAIGISLTGCSSSSKYEDTLNSGLEKARSGDTMSREEYNAVKSYSNWLLKQGEKTYSQWDSGK